MENKFIENKFIKFFMRKAVLIPFVIFLSAGLLAIILVLRSFLQLPENL